MMNRKVHPEFGIKKRGFILDLIGIKTCTLLKCIMSLVVLRLASEAVTEPDEMIYSTWKSETPLQTSWMMCTMMSKSNLFFNRCKAKTLTSQAQKKGSPRH